MNKSIFFLGVVACVFTSCYAGTMSYAPADPYTANARRAAISDIEDDAFNKRHRERMSRAEATRIATENAPDTVHSTTVFAPSYHDHGW